VFAALPAIAFAIVIVSQGGLVFALGLIALGVLALAELYRMMGQVRPANLAGFVAVAGLVLAANYGDQFQIVLALALAVPVTFLFTLMRPRREHASWAMAVVLFGAIWIGLAFAHAVLLRKLDHGGALVVDVLIGTFVGDTCAYFGGRAWGRTPLAPRISPNKTLEGLIAGIVGGTLAFWLFAFSYQDWFRGADALLIGFCVALAAPLGDLFESLIKRDLEVKDTGRFFGPHGGVLDRLDAVFFTAVTAYYVAVAVL
jgi:phosphatidate cytidylyltransferase